MEPAVAGLRGVPLDPLFRLSVSLRNRRLQAFGNFADLDHQTTDFPDGLAAEIVVNPKAALPNRNELPGFGVAFPGDQLEAFLDYRALLEAECVDGAEPISRDDI